ncbi:MAG: hypothetical protein AB1815_13020, partial [Bacillota bacterium]
MRKPAKIFEDLLVWQKAHLFGLSFITELIRPKTPASVGGGFQRAVKSSMDSANIQRGLNPPL